MTLNSTTTAQSENPNGLPHFGVEQASLGMST
jgi:hypothetical protein